MLLTCSLYSELLHENILENKKVTAKGPLFKFGSFRSLIFFEFNF